MIRLKRENLSFYLLVTFWTLVSLAKLIQNPFVMYAAILVAVFVMYTATDSQRVGFALMLVPNIRMFDGLGTTILINILLFLPLVFKIISERRINKTALLHTVILASMEMVHLLFNQTFEFIIPNMVTIFTLMYVESVLLDEHTHTNFPAITRMFAFGSIYSAVMYFVVNVTMHIDMSLYFRGLEYRYQGYASDPNYFSLYMCLAIAMLFIIPHHKKRDIVYIFALAFIELFTLSKMALVLLIITVLYFGVKAVWHGFSGKMRFVKYILLVGAGLAVIFSNRIVTLLEVTLRRLQQHNGTAVNIDTITSGRTTLTSFYFEHMLSDPLIFFFGQGLQYNNLYDNSLSHNTLFDILLSWGIVGVAFMVFIFYTLFRYLRRTCPERITIDHYVPFFILILTFMALSCLSASMFWWVVCAALLPLKGIDYEQITADHRSRSGI